MFKKILQWKLKFFAKALLKKYRPKVVGITGSVGKTSAKEAIFCVLKNKFKARASHKNYNNEIGLPLAIIGVQNSPGRSLLGWSRVFWRALILLLTKDMTYPEVLALEMGADKIGDIAYLVGIAPCRVAVLTAISHAHSEFLGSLKKIAAEKRVIISHLGADDYAVLNYDSSIVMEQAGFTRAKKITYGLAAGANVRGEEIKIINDEISGWPVGVNFKISAGGSSVPVFLSGTLGEGAVSAALAAIAVGSIFGVNTVEAAEALRNLAPSPGRMRLIAGVKNTLLIDDTYNASPEAGREALRALNSVAVKPGARRFAVLGDMLELGAETENAHRELGLLIGELGIDFLITVGEATKLTAQAAREAGLSDNQIASFADSPSAGRFLQEKLKEGDLALVKGSQGLRMEKIVKEVMNEPLKASQLLVRQSAEWLTN